MRPDERDALRRGRHVLPVPEQRRLQANYSYARPKTPPSHSLAAALGTAHAYNVTEVGATIQATSFDAIQIAGIQRNIHGVSDETLGVELGCDHRISKRTSLYARAGYLKNHGQAMMSWPGISVTTPHSSQTLAVPGISHLFRNTLLRSANR
ncbi:hypothetical protein AB4Y43_23555 [Paraburkholderia sp. BR10872]|uniref:hypothetical protein n=1 Tax=Paraburkholderia sp. BR10872 TaxID=3236989 RepID=UPI0034D185E9